MKNKKIYVTLFIIILILNMLVAACKTQKEQPVKTLHLKEVAHSILYAPIYIAISQGFFEEETLNVKIETLTDNEEIIASLYAKNSDIILVGPQTSIILFKENLEEKLVNIAQLVQRDPSYLMSREPKPNFKWKDLKKKIIIGGIQTSTPEILLEYVLLKNDLSPYKEVDIINNIPKDASIGAFKGGVGDYIHLLEPEVSHLENSGSAYLIASLDNEVGEIAYTNFLTTDSYLNKNPIIVQKFVNALYKAQLWCNYHNPEEIAKTLQDSFPEYKLDLIIKVVTRYKNQKIWAVNPIIELQAFDKFQQILIDSGALGEKIPLTSILDNSFAEKTVKEIPIPKEYLKKK
ncbi:MAG: NitT/TauT family transport system substrate-binding protein [Clostridia bacterium]|jgi:NitT/TauT family transport system substrate-binding protein|nr:NitT/TauT family transport system substrate-binding protein [Clostridia bacterium]MDN5324017.1 NitT/TauT family transport system substrate-binding protein [Clostridia bacterium]